MKSKYLFGPVLSRRLGISLGIDLIPYKTCSLNCVYCECGITDNLTIELKEYVPVDVVIEELKIKLSDKPKLDYITFAGSGEPTLNSGLGKVVDFIKNNYPQYKTALLTNGTLFYLDSVLEQIKNIDLLIPSLDAGSEEVFQKLNRPAGQLDFEKIITGAKKIRDYFKGEMWLEVFLVPGLNDSRKELEAMSAIAKIMKPSHVQINSLDRPPAESWVEAANAVQLEDVAQYFDNAKIIGKAKVEQKEYEFKKNLLEKIIATLKRRPVTVEDLISIFSVRKVEILKYLGKIEIDHNLEKEEGKRGIFYFIRNNK
ncbi:MAG: radical SAM protein [Deltaproteobacteria bacterium]|jgi:wyosine [tRNA(Phe)-imidazoG37] synthetase (radical SAM superfamily)|nr:radical SAM protein [Deltaproteobacteria bacterium]